MAEAAGSSEASAHQALDPGDTGLRTHVAGALGLVLAALWLAALDARVLSWGALGYEAAVLGALALATFVGDLLSISMRRLDRALPGLPWGPGALCLVVCPLALGVLRASRHRSELSLWIMGALLVVALALLASAWLGRRVALRFQWTQGVNFDPPLPWALVLCAGFFALHAEMATLAVVRPGVEWLHIAMYLGTWIVTYFLGSACAARVSFLAGRGSVVLGLVLVVVGWGFREADRRLLVGLYAEAHAWLGACSVLFTFAGAVGLTQAAFRKVSSGRGAANRGARTALPVRVAAALGLAAALSAPLALAFVELHRELRGQLMHTPFGATVLYFAPTLQREAHGEPALRALRHEQHLATTLEGGPYDILLITVDAMRRDAIAHAPRLTELASRSLHFSQAYAQGARTAIGMSTLMLGRYSANIEWRLWHYHRGEVTEVDPGGPVPGGEGVFTTLPEARPGALLAERLKGLGYVTLAVPYAHTNQFFGKDTVFARGFDVFADLTAERFRLPSSTKLSELALEQRRQLRDTDKAFQWIHFYDPHEARRDKEAYARLVRAFDDALGRLLDGLGPRAARTIVAVTADHGEAFGEHSRYTHGSALYEEQVGVPLVLFVPGVDAKVIDVPVAAIDVTATLLASVGGPVHDLDGVNLLVAARNPSELAQRPVFSELHRYRSNEGKRTADLKAVRLGNLKLIWDRARDTIELFDLASDPEELRNLRQERPQEAARLQSVLDAFVASEETRNTLP